MSEGRRRLAITARRAGGQEGRKEDCLRTGVAPGPEQEFLRQVKEDLRSRELHDLGSEEQGWHWGQEDQVAEGPQRLKAREATLRREEHQWG